MSGWKLVPVEPTAEMYAAASVDSREQLIIGSGYRAMIEAAPLPPSATCQRCQQEDHGQTGEYLCSACGLPTLHDDPPPSAGDGAEIKTLATTTRWFIGQWEAQSPEQRGWHTSVKGLSVDVPDGTELIDRAHFTALQAQLAATEAKYEAARDRKNSIVLLQQQLAASQPHALKEKIRCAEERIAELELAAKVSAEDCNEAERELAARKKRLEEAVQLLIDLIARGWTTTADWQHEVRSLLSPTEAEKNE